MTYNNLTSLEVHAALLSTSRSAMYFLARYKAALSLLSKQHRKESIDEEHRILKWGHR